MYRTALPKQEESYAEQSYAKNDPKDNAPDNQTTFVVKRCNTITNEI